MFLIQTNAAVCTTPYSVTTHATGTAARGLGQAIGQCCPRMHLNGLDSFTVGCARSTRAHLYLLQTAGPLPDDEHSGCGGFQCWCIYVQTFIYVHNALLYI
jgi:hypothetical protein